MGEIVTGRIMTIDGEHIFYQNLTIIMNTTTITLHSGITGTTVCQPSDEYNEERGIKIAYLKAKAKEIEICHKRVIKELKRLSHM